MNTDAEPNNLDTSAALDRDLMNEEFVGEAGALSNVDVKTDWAEGRQRQISARIEIPHPVEQVWQILTDYEHLSDFIPSLSKSRLIQHPTGGIRLEQIGAQSFLKIKFCARVVLDMVEHFPNQLSFQMIEGDFKAFDGSWLLQPCTLGSVPGTNLCYTVRVLPPLTMPISLIERRLQHNLMINLNAVRQRADELFSHS